MEANNMKAMREAVVLALSLLDLKEGVSSKAISQKDIDFIKAALAKPPRQCDVGTAEEQRKRFGEFCKSFYDKVGCEGCPFWTRGRLWNNCELKWAQMPYEERGDI